MVFQAAGTGSVIPIRPRMVVPTQIVRMGLQNVGAASQTVASQEVTVQVVPPARTGPVTVLNIPQGAGGQGGVNTAVCESEIIYQSPRIYDNKNVQLPSGFHYHHLSSVT